MTRPSTIAIDGPAGAGKSTISEALAARYGYIFVDTGAFYRAITYTVIRKHIALDDRAGIAHLARTLQLRFQAIPGGYRLFANDEDITGHLRSQAVDATVSTIAQMPEVREALLPLQRAAADQGNIILAGRDIGSVVIPDADLKLYIDATVGERARRRYAQLGGQDAATSLESIEKALVQRDKTDSERSHSPLVRSPDAVYILTDDMSVEEVVAHIGTIIQAWPHHKT
ncbi:MAG: (d)CMP kinase [Anaerolineales bacterium]